MWSKKLAVVIAFFALSNAVVMTSPESDATPFRFDYYENDCADLEEMVWSIMRRIVLTQHNAPAQLLRLLFHDCFIEGCDASVMLAESTNNGTVERDAIPNRTLKGFNFIDMIKDEVEEACPGFVSCSDILVLATRDGIVLAEGTSRSRSLIKPWLKFHDQMGISVKLLGCFP